MGNLAVILHEGTLGPSEARVSRVLDFFAVPWKAIPVLELAEAVSVSSSYTLVGSASLVAAAFKAREGSGEPLPHPAAAYAYADDDRGPSSSALQFLSSIDKFSLREAAPGDHFVTVCTDLADAAGPMTGLTVQCKLHSEDSVLTNGRANGKATFAPIISAGDYPVSVRFERDGIPIFFCASSHMVDLEQPIIKGFYDVKDHFISVVSLLIFIRFAFPDVAWRPQEFGACLIIDDPLLRSRYGHCDFGKLRALMHRHGFTTNIAFIPWNWRRTSGAASNFFLRESNLFSVSIHGCDHTAREFGATSPEVLNNTARLAQTRMQNHKARTRVQHDSVMVFPQGVFSSGCADALKHNGFLAAVNTEVVPVDSENAKTRIQDVWDIAITAYGGFPIFTRRYAFHGLENFAFDLFLGKPCLIVAHHDHFQDGGAGLVGLIDRINALNCRLIWRSLGEVIRRACRMRFVEADRETVQMYGNELRVANPSSREIEIVVRKRRGDHDLLSAVLCDGKPIAWATESEYHTFRYPFEPRTQKLFHVVYGERTFARSLPRTLRFELLVAVRRLLCELRDDYIERSRLLSIPATKLIGALKKMN